MQAPFYKASFLPRHSSLIVAKWLTEAFAVVGVVSSIVQIIDFSSKILHRLGEFQSSLGDIPEIFRHIKADLRVLQDTLQQTSH
jgi:hypothetical protein